MTLQEQLCEKMRVEQSAYCLWLTAQPPEEILHHAYEYSVREDIILATEEMNLTPAQVRALLKSPAPLADVYKDFSKLETDYMSMKPARWPVRNTPSPPPRIFIRRIGRPTIMATARSGMPRAM